MKIDRRILLTIFLISFFMGSFFALFFTAPVEADAGQYDTIGWNLARGNGFSMEPQAPFIPTMYREPAYPILLSAIYKMFGHNYIPVHLFQILIFSLTCILIYFLARDIFGERVGRYSAVLAAICPTLANYPSYLMTETIFIFLLCASLSALTKAVKTQRIRWFFISGLILGITALCRATIVLFFFMVFLGVFLLKKNWKHFFKKGLMQLAIFSFAFLIVISPWSYRNYHLFGSAQISLRGGLALWEVAHKLNDSFEVMKQRAVFNFSEYIGARLFPEVANNPRDVVLMHSKSSHARENQLRQQGFDPVQIDNIMRKEALEKIQATPRPFFKILSHISIELIQMAGFLYIPALNETHIIEGFYRLNYGKILLSGIRGIFRLLAYPILFFVLVVIFKKRLLWRQYIFLLSIIVYINFIYVILGCIARYAVPLIPFYLIFATAGVISER